jgi:hypothetical protein
MDQFYEQLMVGKKTTVYNLANFGVYILGILGFLFISVNPIIGLILVIVASGSFFYKKNLYVEYEYDFTNGEIDIDRILEMKKRKRIITFSIKDVELLAEENSTIVKDFANKPKDVVTFLPSGYDGKVFVAMLTNGTERKMIRFAPNDKFLDLCFKLNPRAVKKFM